MTWRAKRVNELGKAIINVDRAIENVWRFKHVVDNNVPEHSPTFETFLEALIAIGFSLCRWWWEYRGDFPVELQERLIVQTFLKFHNQEAGHGGEGEGNHADR